MNQAPVRKFRNTQVISVDDLSPHLKRIVLGGKELIDFETGHDGAHVKAIFPTDGKQLSANNWASAIKRSYTIRAFDNVNKHLVLDFVINRHQGPATNWALKAKVGDSLGIAGPGARKLTNFNAESYVLIGDITSMNAVNGYAKFIPSTAELTAIITVPTRADVIEMDALKPSNTHWHVEDETTSSLFEFVKNRVKGVDVNSQVFVGLEASQVRELKALFLNEVGVERLNVHATGYWKKGLDADRFSMDKQRNPL